jgi:Protein of unknown function (DUF3987)
LEEWQKCPNGERSKKPIPPAQQEYYLQDATLEAIAACLSSQPDRGVVIPIDELSGFFNGFNQYRSGGKGSDRQKYLSAYNGGAIKVNRKSGNRVSLTQTSISLTGTIQPGVLRRQMSDLDEVDGFWARFIWIPLPLTEMPPPGEGVHHDLSGLLRRLYEGLESLVPQTYRFDRRGQALWRDWHSFCEKQKVNEPNSPLRAIYPKSKERAARIALVAHCINAVVEGQVPDQVIPSDLLEAAIAFTKWSIGKTRLIYADAGAVSHEETARIVRFIERFRAGGWITARNVTHWWTTKPKPKAEAARAFMRQVVDLGHASDNGKTGRDYAICIQENTSNSGNDPLLPLASRGFERGNKSGNSLVTTGSTQPEMPSEQAIGSGNKLGNPLDHSMIGVTTAHCSHNTSNSKGSSDYAVELLPDVTHSVISPNPAPSKASTALCYPVTGTRLQIDDRVVLTGEGNNCPTNEIKAIWTVETIQGQKVVVYCETVGRRVFPEEWLALYERAAKAS